MSAWLVAALIAAWQLPDDPFEIVDCRIEKLKGDPRRTPRLEGGGGLQLQPAVQNQAAPYSSPPPQTRFFSYHQAVTRVEAENAKEQTKKLMAELTTIRDQACAIARVSLRKALASGWPNEDTFLNLQPADSSEQLTP